MLKLRKDKIANFFKIEKQKVLFFDHHLCHAYYGYYGLGEFNKKKIVVTLDGGGDGKNATISIGYKGKLNTLYSTNIGNIGHVLFA